MGLASALWRKGEKETFDPIINHTPGTMKLNLIINIMPLKKGYTFEELFGIKRAKEIKEKMSKNNKGMLGKHHSEETKRKISEANKGKKCHMFGKHHSEETKKKLSIANKISQLGSKHSEKTKQKIREARKKQIFPKHHTKPELKFMELIKKYNLPYKFTGDSRFWIENINPDFINCNGEKTCVEIFGDYWHNLPKALIKDKEKLIILQKYGWKRIVIWEHEINDKSLVLSKLK